MTTQLDAAFELIAVDGSHAFFLETANDEVDQFETHSGVSLADLEHADRTETTVFVPSDDRHYTVTRVQS